MENATAQLLAKWKEYKTAAFNSVREGRNGVIINFSAFMDWLEAHQEQTPQYATEKDFEKLHKQALEDTEIIKSFHHKSEAHQEEQEDKIGGILEEFLDKKSERISVLVDLQNLIKETNTQARNDAIDEAIKVIDNPQGHFVLDKYREEFIKKLEELKK